jgi:predicted nucleotidyltransferase
MRLDKKYIDIIKKTISDRVDDASIFLFGSRVDDRKKGGDIDLYIKTSQNITLKDELALLTKLELNGIGRKIDLIFDTPEKDRHSFFQSIKDKAILL